MRSSCPSLLTSLPLIRFLRMQAPMNASIEDGIRLFSIALLFLPIGMRSTWPSTSSETSPSSSMSKICASLKSFWPSAQVEQANCSISRNLDAMRAYPIPRRTLFFLECTQHRRDRPHHRAGISDQRDRNKKQRNFLILRA